MRVYEDENINKTTEEVAAYDVIRCRDLSTVVQLVELGFNYVCNGDDYIFLATPKLLTVLRAINKIKEFTKK